MRPPSDVQGRARLELCTLGREGADGIATACGISRRFSTDTRHQGHSVRRDFGGRSHLPSLQPHRSIAGCDGGRCRATCSPPAAHDARLCARQAARNRSRKPGFSPACRADGSPPAQSPAGLEHRGARGMASRLCVCPRGCPLRDPMGSRSFRGCGSWRPTCSGCHSIWLPTWPGRRVSRAGTRSNGRAIEAGNPQPRPRGAADGGSRCPGSTFYG